MRLTTTCAVASVCFTVISSPRESSLSARSATLTADVTPAAHALPELPRESVDTREVPSTRRPIRVPEGGDLQRALNEAEPGDQIVLDSGATYHGPFRLREKPGEGWVVVTSTAHERLPPAGGRVNPSHSELMPKLRASSAAVVTAEPGAHHYRFVGIDIAPSDRAFLHALVQLGGDETDPNRLPHHIILDRCYLHGEPMVGTRRGIAMNSRHTAVTGSYLSDFKEVGADSQAIAGWNGPGPFTISNNYLEAAGESVMFGGVDPAIAGLVPADIEITRNHMAKPLRWKKGDREFQGTPWTIKNLFELKNARRVLIDSNLFEYNWPDGQNGFAILFTVRNQSGGAPWSVVEDVVFSNNVVRHAGGGINILGLDDNHPSQRTRRLAIRGNLFVDIGGQWGAGRLFQLLNGTEDISIDHNTAFQTGSLLFGGDHAPHVRFVFEGNIALHNEYGITGSGTASGTSTLERFFPGSRVRDNVIVGGDAGRYPRDNFFPSTLEEAGFVPGPDGGYRRVSSRLGVASDERSIGADIDALTTAAADVSSPPRDPPPMPSPRRSLMGTQTFGLPDWRFDGDVEPTVFWGALSLLAYVYIGYPLLTWLRASVHPQHHLRAPMEPFVSVVVVAHNEADRIDARIENLLALDYPRDRLEILVGSDGSTDDTVRRANRYTNSAVRVHAFGEWRGKAAVLDDLVPRARGQIVVFADARQRFELNVLRALVSHFADPKVGAVSGELILTVDGELCTSAGQGTAFYWKYEKFIRLHESRAASTVGATGSIYAIRRSLFEPIPTDTILDDVMIPLRIVRRGYYTLFEPEALAYDKVSATAHQEYVRKLRTIAGTFQLFAKEPWLFNPFRNPVWFETISHKALRLVIPVLHVALFVANVALMDESAFYQLTMAGQIGFYAAAFAGHVLRHAHRRPVVVTVPYAMCLLGWATIAGFMQFITHRQHATWEQATPTSVALMSPATRRNS